MYFLLYITAIISVYIASFKDNFNKENIEKSVPVIILFTGIVFIIAILSSIIRR